MSKQKQEKLNQDYADFVVEHEAAKAQSKALGTFLKWLHKSDRNGVMIIDSKKR